METPRLYRQYYRNGPPHRSGADVSFGDIVKIFGFRSVDIGAWVNKHEQQIAANLFFDALCDLMDILQVSEAVISLNGSLALAFGTGGEKHSSAHYDSRRRRLALAKNAGGGALAHEWFHAFDHYICPKVFQHSQPQDFASQAWLHDNALKPHPLNTQLSQCFQHLFLHSNRSQASDFMLRSAAADRAAGIYYFAQPQEMAARAFEAVIQDQAIKNAFLVQGTKQSAEAKLGIYPTDSLRKTLAEHFFAYFSALGQAVK